MTKKEKVTLSIEAELMNEVRHYCVDKKIEYSSFIEQLLREKLGKKK